MNTSGGASLDRRLMRQPNSTWRNRQRLLRAAPGAFTSGLRSVDEPGFIATALHKSIDGTHVINYAHWRSQADHENFVNKHGADFAQLAQYAHFDPHLYEVVYLSERTEGN